MDINMPSHRSFFDYLKAQQEIKEQFLREQQAFSTIPPKYDPVIAECYEDLAIIHRILGNMDAYWNMLDFSTRYGSWYERFHLSVDDGGLLTGAPIEPGSPDENIVFGRQLLDVGILLTLAQKDPEKSRVLFASADAHCTILPEYAASRHDRYGLTRIAYSYLWKGYALLCLQRFDEAERVLSQVAPIYRALKLQSTHNPQLSAVIEMALTTALVPLCAFKRVPIKENLVKAQNGLENFIGVIHDNFYRLRGYTYYFHLKEQFADIYAADPARFPDSIPGVESVPLKPVLVYVEKQNNWIGSIYIQDPEIIRRREYLCSNWDFRLFSTYCRALETLPALTLLIDVYALGQCTDPRPVAAECERLGVMKGIDPQILKIASRIGTYAREAERQNSGILLDYDPYHTPEPDIRYFPKPPVRAFDSLSAGTSRPPLVPRRAHSIALEQTRRGRIAIGLHDVDDPGINLREYLARSPEYRALSDSLTNIPEAHAIQSEGFVGLEQTSRYWINPVNDRVIAFEGNVRRLMLVLDTISLSSERLQRVKQFIDAAAFSEAYDAIREEGLASEQKLLLAARADRSMNLEEANALLRENAYEYFIKALLADLAPVDAIDITKNRFFQQSLKSYPLPDVLFECGVWCQRTYTKNEPEAAYQRILKEYKGSSPRFIGATLHNLAVMYLDSGDLKKSEDLLQEMLEYCRLYLSHETETYIPYIATALSNLASLYTELKDYEKAERFSREAQSHYRICVTTDSYKFLPALARETLKTVEILDARHESTLAEEELETAAEIYLTLTLNDPIRYLPMYADALMMKRVLLGRRLYSAKRFGPPGYHTKQTEKEILDISMILQDLQTPVTLQ